MKFIDFSPANAPTPDQQQDALQKGLGRALQWAKAGCLAETLVLEACVHDKRYDMQCEDSRGNWLWDIIQVIDAQERFHDPIFNALNEIIDERSLTQLCELAFHYAKAGSESFRSRLYEIVEEKPLSDDTCLGEEEILDLDGEKAFLFVARVRGERLAKTEWDWTDKNFATVASERFGEERVSNLLMSSTDSRIKRFHKNWKERSHKKSIAPSRSTHREQMQAIRVNEIIEVAQSDDQCYWFRGWGMYADEASLRAVLDILLSTNEVSVISRLLKVFSNRAILEFDCRLLDLCQHIDEDVRLRAFTAISKNSDPAIRKFALEQLEVEASYSVVSLFINNFENGDEELILPALSLQDDSFQLHSLLMDIIKVLEKNTEANYSKLGIIAYALTPCEGCRFDAAQLLYRQSVVPQWMLEECRYDSNNDTRSFTKNINN